MNYNYKLFVLKNATISIGFDLVGCRFGARDPKRGGTLMPYTGAKKSLTLIVSQLEAASTLIKFAASDLGDLASRAGTPLPDELRLIGENLHSTAGVLEGNVAFFIRLAEEARATKPSARPRRGKISGSRQI